MSAMRVLGRLLRNACLLTFVIGPLSGSVVAAAGSLSATVLVMDALASSNQSTTIDARLIAQGLSGVGGLAGEPLELVIGGKVVATAKTDADGKVSFTHIPKALGVMPVLVRVGESPRVTSAEAQANLLVWEKRNPIVLIEMASLLEGGDLSSLLSTAAVNADADPKPMPDAAYELGKLTQFYYRAIYVLNVPQGMDGFHAGARARAWLKAHEFPAGYVLPLPSDEKALGLTIDNLHGSGWRTIKSGIGRTKQFAEAFLQRRLEAVLVPEPAKSGTPRKAKVVKEWKEMRKKF
jgi:hypothetical protein